MKTLILGGVRSGKSRLAESLARASGLPVTVIATATAGDAEMAARIAAHRAQRDASWQVVEEPQRLAATLAAAAGPGRLVFVDCLTLWLCNLLVDGNEDVLTRERDALLALLPTLPGTLILIGNETSMGVVPLGALTRRFCDVAGSLHQALAQHCDRVLLTIAGLPLALKGTLK